jgi:hypothetical protein
VGVVSFGTLYCENDIPVGFARVSYQKDWILRNTDAGNWQCNSTTAGKHSFVKKQPGFNFRGLNLSLLFTTFHNFVR